MIKITISLLCYAIFVSQAAFAAPLPPALSSPADYSIYNRNDTSSVTFSWSSVSGALEYWLNVFPEDDSSNPKFNNSVSGTSLSVPVSSSWTSAIYIWQVRVRTSAGWSSYSTARQFIVDYPPGPPTLNSPASGASFPIGGSSDFTWTAPTGGTVARYTFRIVSGTDLNLNQKVHKELSGTTDNESFSDSLYDPGTHTWAVRAIKQAPSGYSQSTYETTVRWGEYETRTFTVTLPTAGNPVFVPVFRLYKSADHDHFYTTNALERDNAVKNSGYKYEKIEFYMSDRSFSGGIPLYRYYYGTDKKHYYTTNTSSAKAGYTEGPGIIGYVYPNSTEGMVPLYHLEGTTGDHFYTISKFERDNAINTYNFINWGPQCYISPSAVANNRPQGNFAGIGMFTGAFSVPFTDISLNGVGPALTLTRYYNSYNFYELPLGAGWSHSLYSYVIEDLDGNVTIKWGNGTEDFFQKDGAGNFNGILGTFSKLVRPSNDVYELTAKDQTIYEFSRVTVSNTMGASFIPDLPLIRIKDKFNNQVVMSPNAANGRIDRAYRMVNGAETGQSLTFNYTDISVNGKFINLLSSIVDKSISSNRTIFYAYNADGYLSSVKDARGNETLYAYNADGFLSTITYPEGNTVIIVYDDSILFRRVKDYTAGGITLSFDYNETTGTTVKNGNTTLVNYIHDPQYRADKVTFAENANDFIKPNYLTGNSLNLQENVKDRNGYFTYYTYDANGNVHTVKNPLNEITTFTYDLSNNNLTSVTDPRGNTTQFTYDAATKKELRSIRKPVGGTTTYSYFSNGLVQTVTDPTGHTVTYSYDANGNAIQIKDDALSTSVDFTNDGAGRRKTQNDQQRPDSQLTTWIYDNNDNVTSVQVESHPAAIFRYDKNNRLYNVVDQKSQTTVFTYNLANLLETQTSPDQKKWQYDYDSVGKLSSIALPDGNGITYTYDANKRLQFVRYNGTEKLEYSYDNNGNVLSLQADNSRTTLFQYNEANRVTAITDPFNNVIGYGYDPAGNRNRITYPPSNMVTYTFDADNRLATVKDWLGSAVTTYTYNTAGILQSISNANGTTAAFGYDAANRLTSLANRKSNNSNIASYVINQLDKVGNPLSITRDEPLAPPIPTASDVSYGYNNANQIQSAGSITYSHDGLGNLNGASNGSSFAFDYANHLLSATVGADNFSFVYDAFGNRISRTKNGAQTRYMLDLNADMSNVLAETNAAGEIQNYYIHGLGLISRIDNSGQRFTYHFDQLGNTVGVTDDSNNLTEFYAYDEFGAVLASNGATSNPFRYVGKYGVMDEGNGLLFMRARYYDTDLGRFLSRDPIGFDGGDLNLYAYVENNPIQMIDPIGLWSRSTVKYALSKGVDLFLDPKNWSNPNFWKKVLVDIFYKAGKKIVSSKPVADVGGYLIYEYLVKKGITDENGLEKAEKVAAIIQKGSDTAYAGVSLIIDVKSLYECLKNPATAEKAIASLYKASKLSIKLTKEIVDIGFDAVDMATPWQ